MRLLLVFLIVSHFLADVWAKHDVQPVKETSLSETDIKLKSSPNRRGMSVVIATSRNNPVFVALENEQQHILPHSIIPLSDSFCGKMEIRWVNEQDVILTAKAFRSSHLQLLRIYEKNGKPSLKLLYGEQARFHSRVETSHDLIEFDNGYGAVDIQIKKSGGSKLPPGKRR